MSGRIADWVLGQDALRDLDTGRTQRRHTGRTAALHGTAVGQHFARGRVSAAKAVSRTWKRSPH